VDTEESSSVLRYNGRGVGAAFIRGIRVMKHARLAVVLAASARWPPRRRRRLPRRSRPPSRAAAWCSSRAFCRRRRPETSRPRRHASSASSRRAWNAPARPLIASWSTSVYLSSADDFPALNPSGSGTGRRRRRRERRRRGAAVPGRASRFAVAAARGVERRVVLPARWPAPSAPLSHGVRAGQVLFLSGQVPAAARTTPS